MNEWKNKLYFFLSGLCDGSSVDKQQFVNSTAVVKCTQQPENVQKSRTVYTTTVQCRTEYTTTIQCTQQPYSVHNNRTVYTFNVQCTQQPYSVYSFLSVQFVNQYVALLSLYFYTLFETVTNQSI